MKENVRFIITNLVIYETAMLLERKVPKKEAVKFLKAVLKGPLVELFHADEYIEQEGFTVPAV